MIFDEFLSFCPVDVSPVVLEELVIRIRSVRLKLVMADAIFRNLCCRNGFTVGDDSLSLKKMVCVFVSCSSLNFPLLTHRKPHCFHQSCIHDRLCHNLSRAPLTFVSHNSRVLLSLVSHEDTEWYYVKCMFYTYNNGVQLNSAWVQLILVFGSCAGKTFWKRFWQNKSMQDLIKLHPHTLLFVKTQGIRK